MKHEIEQLNHRIAHFQTFRHSVARLLHLRDLPDSNIIHRLHSLVNAHDEMVTITKRFDHPVSPTRDRASDDLPPIPSPTLPRRYSDHYLDLHHSHHTDHHVHHDFDDDFKF